MLRVLREGADLALLDDQVACSVSDVILNKITAAGYRISMKEDFVDDMHILYVRVINPEVRNKYDRVVVTSTVMYRTDGKPVKRGNLPGVAFMDFFRTTDKNLRGGGLGRAVMCAVACMLKIAGQKSLELQAVAIEDAKSTETQNEYRIRQQRLIAYYQSFGFVYLPGENKFQIMVADIDDIVKTCA